MEQAELPQVLLLCQGTSGLAPGRGPGLQQGQGGLLVPATTILEPSWILKRRIFHIT